MQLYKPFGFFLTLLYHLRQRQKIIGAESFFHDMPFAIQELQSAYKAYRQFLDRSASPHHARYIFPFFTGSYFAYRKADVARVVAIAKALSSNPTYLDVGCGYGDFLKHVREFLPNAEGIEKEGGIFYSFQIPKPDFISLTPVEAFTQPVDVVFVGWMEPGQDFRKSVARFASKCVITTFDAGGQCGINGACEYDEFGFNRIAWCRTPSWIDVNAELMNRYYTPGLSSEKKEQLAHLRSAHNFWYVYARPEFALVVQTALESWLEKEDPGDRFAFESVLDECGFGYKQELPALTSGSNLWEVIFD